MGPAQRPAASRASGGALEPGSRPASRRQLASGSCSVCLAQPGLVVPVLLSQTSSVETAGMLLESTLSSQHQPGAKGVHLGCF